MEKSLVFTFYSRRVNFFFEPLCTVYTCPLLHPGENRFTSPYRVVFDISFLAWLSPSLVTAVAPDSGPSLSSLSSLSFELFGFSRRPIAARQLLRYDLSYYRNRYSAAGAAIMRASSSRVTGGVFTPITATCVSKPCCIRF